MSKKAISLVNEGRFPSRAWPINNGGHGNFMNNYVGFVVVAFAIRIEPFFQGLHRGPSYEIRHNYKQFEVLFISKRCRCTSSYKAIR